MFCAHQTIPRRFSCAAILFVSLVTPALAQQVPHTEAKALDGSPAIFPQGKPLILVIGFSHKSSKPCEEWAKQLKPSYLNDPKFSYYELAELQGAPALVRRMILHGIRGGMPQDEQRHFVPLFSAEDDWRKAAAYSVPDDAYLMVADSTGHIVWQAHGPPSNAVLSQLKAAVQQLLRSHTD